MCGSSRILARYPIPKRRILPGHQNHGQPHLPHGKIF